jgi:hypothetical protein
VTSARELPKGMIWIESGSVARSPPAFSASRNPCRSTTAPFARLKANADARSGSKKPFAPLFSALAMSRFS